MRCQGSSHGLMWVCRPWVRCELCLTRGTGVWTEQGMNVCVEPPPGGVLDSLLTILPGQ